MRHANSDEGDASGASDVDHIPTSNDGDGDWSAPPHPEGNSGANLQSISHRCYLFEVAFA